MKKIVAICLLMSSMSVFAVPDYCGDPVISPAPIPPECLEPELSGIWERREDQNTLVCQYTDGGWLRINNISLQIPLNNLTNYQRCELMRCIFNDAPWCDFYNL